MKRYGSTTMATDFRTPGRRKKLIRALLFFVPAANPDTEPLFPRVKKWFLEVDDVGVPLREVAVDEEGRVLFRMPDDRNYGFWTDSPVTLSEGVLDAITAEEFEVLWERARLEKEGRIG